MRENEPIHRLEQASGPTLAWHEDSGMGILEVDGRCFKDMARTGQLAPYADWRLPAEDRARDLASRLSIEEIAGLMLYSPHQAVPPRAGGHFPGTFGGATWEESGREKYALSDQQLRFLEKDHIRHILMTTVDDAETAARWSNALQRAAECLPWGIPVNISSDPRSGAKQSAAEFRTSGRDVSKWPEGIGFAACFDPEVVRQFAHDASIEYRAMGITTALGPQIDLCTEPRWLRFADTLGMKTEDVKSLVKAYCDGMQTTSGSAAAVMPYYTVSWGLDRKNGRNVGNSYSEYLVKDLLRERFGFKGVVCTDWGITQDPGPTMGGFGSRCYNMQDHTEPERMLIAILNGVDQFGGNDDPAPVLEAYRLGCEKLGEKAMRLRMEQSAARLLVNIFRCGLFEDPYLDPQASAAVVGCEDFRAHGEEAQRRSVVLLKNRNGCLPLGEGLKIYVPERKIGPSKSFFRTEVPARTDDPVEDSLIAEYGVRVPSPEQADVAIVFAESPSCNPYSDTEGYLPITLQYRPYTATEARPVSIAGGDFREDFTNRSYRGRTNTAYNEADLDNILACRRAMGDKPVIVVETLTNPMVVSEFEGHTDTLVAEFGVSRRAVLDVIFGRYAPRGRLPVQMPRDMAAVEGHCEDVALDIAPHVDEFGHAYDYGFGIGYDGKPLE